jgi:hypothetical protein
MKKRTVAVLTVALIAASLSLAIAVSYFHARGVVEREIASHPKLRDADLQYFRARLMPMHFPDDRTRFAWWFTYWPKGEEHGWTIFLSVTGEVIADNASVVKSFDDMRKH